MLLADLDLLTGVAGLLMQVQPRYTLADALNSLHRMDQKLWKALVSVSGSVDVICPAPEFEPLPEQYDAPHLAAAALLAQPVCVGHDRFRSGFFTAVARFSRVP